MQSRPSSTSGSFPALSRTPTVVPVPRSVPVPSSIRSQNPVSGSVPGFQGLGPFGMGSNGTSNGAGNINGMGFQSNGGFMNRNVQGQFGNVQMGGRPQGFQDGFSGQQMGKGNDFVLHNEEFPTLGATGPQVMNSNTGAVTSGNQNLGQGVQGLQGSNALNLQMQQLLIYQQMQQQQQLQQLQLQYQAQHQQQLLAAALHAQQAQQAIMLPGLNAPANVPESSTVFDLSSVANTLPTLSTVVKDTVANKSVGSSASSNHLSNNVGNYGLLGLLSVTKLTDPDIIALSLGSDLSSFGLDLNSQDVLYPSFDSPFGDSKNSKELSSSLPACYNITPPVLKQSHLTRFIVETLFYIFYNMPRDQIQVFAAKELYLFSFFSFQYRYNRGWKYHKQTQSWFKSESVNGAAPLTVFDLQAWKMRPFQETAALRQSTLTFMSLEEIMNL